MEYRKLGDTDLAVSAVTFRARGAGGWMWGGSDRKVAVKAIQNGYDLGVTAIDTVHIYGQFTDDDIAVINKEHKKIL